MLVLASRSPRRADLLRSLGVPFEVCPPDVSERVGSRSSPRRASVLLAIAKARAVSRLYPDRLVLGADTIVSLGNRILGKPEDAAEARHILESLSGKWHTVWTGICFRHADHRWELSEVVGSRVRFRGLSADEIDEYVASGEALDKAGAYGIQGPAGAFVAKLEGSRTNVIGLPTERVLRILEKHYPDLLPKGRKSES